MQPRDPKTNELPPLDVLQRMKVQEEIEHIRVQRARDAKSILHRPEFYRSVLPIIIVALGVYLSHRQGWFDAQDERLRAERTQLQYDISKSTDEKAYLEAENQALEAERQRLRLQFEQDSVKLALERQGLHRNVESQRQRMETQLGELRSEVDRAAVHAHLQNLLAAVGLPRADDPAASALVETLRMGGDMKEYVRESIISHLGDELPPARKGVLVYVLYQASGEVIWRERFLELLEGTGGNDIGFNSLFLSGSWDERDLVAGIQRAIRAVWETGPDRLGRSTGFMNLIREATRRRVSYADFDNHDDFLNLIIILRDVALQDRLADIHRTNALNYLGSLAPGAYYAVIANLIEDKDEVAFAMDQLSTRDRLSRIYPYNQLVRAGSDLSVPEQLEPDDWIEWSRGGTSSLRSWLDPSLAAFRNDTDSLREQLFLAES